MYPVVELVANTDLHDHNHVLHIDNWFTSLPLAEFLKEEEIDSVGTVRTNRKGMPQEAVFPKKGAGKQPKGTVKCMQKEGSGIYFTSWQDNKPVHMLSSIKPSLVKIWRKSSTDGWKRVEIDSHSLIKAYNYGMGGTDRMDQLNSYYNFNHKGIRWTHRVFTHFLGVAAMNACILYNKSNGMKRLSSIQFMDEVIKSLADLDRSHNWNDLDSDHEEEPVLSPVENEGSDNAVALDLTSHSVGESLSKTGRVYRRYRKSNLEGAVERLEGIHYPTLLSSTNRRRCVFHTDVKQRYFCTTCDVALCLSECAEESCWFKYHHQETWKKI
jgi:hypothetical protein